jgi:uncharacterized protein YggE
MRKMMMIVIGVTFIAANAAVAQADRPLRSISVTGTVETKTAPDQIVWRINLSDRDPDMRKAAASNDERIKSVVALRQKLGIDEGDFETGRLSVQRDYERDQYGRPQAFKGFIVSRSVTLRQRDLKRFDEFLDSLMSSTEMEVNFSFESSRIHEVRAETRLKALRAAQAKATAMAEVVGAKVARVLTVNEHPAGDRSQSVMSNSFSVETPVSPDFATDRFVPGAIDVRVTVYATFELE